MTRNLLIKIFQVPPPIDEFVEFTPSLQNYKPIFYINNYWNLNKVNLDSWISIIRKELEDTIGVRNFTRYFIIFRNTCQSTIL